MRDAVRTAAGEYVLCGATAPSADGRPDVWIGTIDPHGRAAWTARPFGNDRLDTARSIATAPDGGYVVAGTSSRGADAVADGTLAKTDANGHKRWQKRFGGAGFECCNCVVATRDGGYALCGGTHTFAATGLDAWLVKTDSDGEREWAETYGRSRADVANAVVQTEDGGYVLVGRTDGGGTGVWVVKTDDSGTREWERRLGGTGYDVATAVIETTAGGYAIVGHTTSFGATRKNAWIVQLDAAGAEAWSRTYETDGHAIGRDIVQASADEYAIVCDEISPGGRTRSMLLTTGSDGEWRRARTVGTRSRASAGFVDPSSGAYAVAGTALARRPVRGGDAWLATVPSAEIRSEGRFAERPLLESRSERGSNRRPAP